MASRLKNETADAQAANNKSLCFFTTYHLRILSQLFATNWVMMTKLTHFIHPSISSSLVT